jgi:hypothetical protein
LFKDCAELTNSLWVEIIFQKHFKY